MKKLSIQVLADDQVKIDTDSFIKAACYFQVLLDHCRRYLFILTLSILRMVSVHCVRVANGLTPFNSPLSMLLRLLKPCMVTSFITFNID